MCRVCREFKVLLQSYVDAVSRGSIRPSPGRNIRDNVLNDDQQYMTVFVPTDDALARSSAYERERYLALRNAVDPLLLQKVRILSVLVQIIALVDIQCS